MTPHGGDGRQSMRQELGVWNVLPNQESALPLGDYFDFVYIDLEHGFRSIDELSTTIKFYNLKKTNYSVRVRNVDDSLIQTLLDLGVRNFVLPQIRLFNEIEIFKRKISFPPLGVRGLHPRSNYKSNVPQSEAVSLTIIIETVEALELLNEIAGDPMVSELYLGVFDLSLELGIKDGAFSKKLDEYFLQVKTTCEKHNKKFVAMLPDGEDISFATRHGLDKVVVGIDASLINQFYIDLIANLRRK
jgi:2-keto-3-deoxy-L-rhamnonate aldolase RhmA